MNVNKWTKSFVFKTENSKLTLPNVKNFYSDLAMLGKHFTVISLQHDGQTPVKENRTIVRRHYTICNAMKKNFYEALVKAVQGKGSIEKALISDTDGDEINMTIKTYGLNQGLSTRFFTCPNETFQIKGPMGRGLELNKDSKGNFMAFAAGTGVLVFMDLVAKIVLKELNVP